MTITLCGSEAAAEVHRLTQLAFRDYDKLDPPSGAVRETEASVCDDLAHSGGALALRDGGVVGCLRFDYASQSPSNGGSGGRLTVRRLAVDPAYQGQGVGTAMMRWAHEYARAHGFDAVRVGVRPQLAGNVRLYERLGYRLVAEHRHPGYERTTWIEMLLPV